MNIIAKRGQKTHGMSKSPEYRIWKQMKNRCTNPDNISYKNYGGRGITFSEEWLSFVNFITDLGKRPSENHSLDRIDNNKNYYKDNCKWSTKKEQSRNKRDNRYIEYNGESMVLIDWCNKLNLSFPRTRYRLNSGKSIEECFSSEKRNIIGSNNGVFGKKWKLVDGKRIYY